MRGGRGGNLFGERDSASKPCILNNSRHEIQNKSFKKTVYEIMREKKFENVSLSKFIKIYQKLIDKIKTLQPKMWHALTQKLISILPFYSL